MHRLHQTPEQIVETMIQEDAGAAIRSGAHTGISLELKRLGVVEVFTRGSLVENIVGLLQMGRAVRGAERGWAMSSATVDL